MFINKKIVCVGVAGSDPCDKYEEQEIACYDAQDQKWGYAAGLHGGKISKSRLRSSGCDGSLKDKIECAPEGATITFAPALTGQTIILTSGEIIIDKDITLAGLGMLDLTISRYNSSRIFHVQLNGTLTVENMGLKDGISVTNGGAMCVEGGLNLLNVLLQNNFENGDPKSMTIASTAVIEFVGPGSVEIKF